MGPSTQMRNINSKLSSRSTAVSVKLQGSGISEDGSQQSDAEEEESEDSDLSTSPSSVEEGELTTSKSNPSAGNSNHTVKQSIHSASHSTGTGTSGRKSHLSTMTGVKVPNAAISTTGSDMDSVSEDHDGANGEPPSEEDTGSDARSTLADTDETTQDDVSETDHSDDGSATNETDDGSTDGDSSANAKDKKNWKNNFWRLRI